MDCRVCKVPGSITDENHLLDCSVINDEYYEVHYNDVFGSTEQQYKYWGDHCSAFPSSKIAQSISLTDAAVFVIYLLFGYY